MLCTFTMGGKSFFTCLCGINRCLQATMHVRLTGISEVVALDVHGQAARS